MRSLLQRPLSREEELLEVLARDGGPVVAAWARAQRGKVRDAEALLAALDALQARDDTLARSLAAAVWLAWREFGGCQDRGQPPLRRAS